MVDWLRELGLVILWRMLGSLGAGFGPAASTWFCVSDSFFMPGLSQEGVDNGWVTLKDISGGKRGLIQDAVVEGADQAKCSGVSRLLSLAWRFVAITAAHFRQAISKVLPAHDTSE